MLIRPYQPDDDEALMAIERQSARGFPTPFVHFRRRFIERAELYPLHHTVVALKDEQLVGMSSIIVKDTMIGNARVKMAYSFDTRVLPHYRRQGVGHAMVEEKLKWAKAQGAIGVYSLIVATNHASLAMVDKSGYKRVRMVIYTTFPPSPLLDPLPIAPQVSNEPVHQNVIRQTYQHHDLYVPDTATSVQALDFQRWYIQDRGCTAGLSVFNQAKIYTKISPDAPWPSTEEQIARLGRNLQIFDATGLERPDLIRSIFETIRDDAVMTNVNKITWLIDRNDNFPEFVFKEATHQMDYWLMYKAYYADAELEWKDSIYLDPRDI